MYPNREFQTGADAAGPGTPFYMAPERERGVEKPAGDVYSLGMVALVLLTRTSPRNIISSTLGEPSRWPERIQKECEDSQSFKRVWELGLEMIQTEYTDRPSAAEVHQRVESLLTAYPRSALGQWAKLEVPRARERREVHPTDQEDDLVGTLLVEEISSGEPAPTPSSPPGNRDFYVGTGIGVLVAFTALLSVTLVLVFGWVIWIPKGDTPLRPVTSYKDNSVTPAPPTGSSQEPHHTQSMSRDLPSDSPTSKNSSTPHPKPKPLEIPPVVHDRPVVSPPSPHKEKKLATNNSPEESPASASQSNEVVVEGNLSKSPTTNLTTYPKPTTPTTTPSSTAPPVVEPVVEYVKIVSHMVPISIVEFGSKRTIETNTMKASVPVGTYTITALLSDSEPEVLVENAQPISLLPGKQVHVNCSIQTFRCWAYNP